MADYPNKLGIVPSAKSNPKGKGNVIDSNVEGRAVDAKSVRMNSKGGKRGAGHVGSSNVNIA